jgi:hypothetical protein
VMTDWHCQDNGGKGGRWEGLPDQLTPMFDLDKMVHRLRKELPVSSPWNHDWADRYSDVA